MVSAVRRFGDAMPARPGVLIVVQNLPVPLDRRVWLECQALRDAGFDVTVVCPKAPGDPGYEVIDGVSLYKYRHYPPTRRKGGMVLEDIYSFSMTALLVARAWRCRRFDVLQACNPQDVFWPLGLVFKALAGGRFVFDQHDLCPELYRSRFPDGPRWIYHGVRLLEWCTYRAADHVIAPNESYRATAMARGEKALDRVTVVRSGPDAARLHRSDPDPSLRRGRRYLVCYLGVMGPQDGVDLVVRAASTVVHDLGRQDISFTLMGGGDCLDEARHLSGELDVADYVLFTGRVPDDLVFAMLSTADVGLSPDPKNPLNDVSTMNKTMEYMAFELPVVAFDLKETRFSAGDAAVYVHPDDHSLYAKAIVDLLDDEPRRREMGRLGRLRVESELGWNHQRERYVALYDRLLGREVRPKVAERAV